jgi:dipeptide/tripeptide permease
MRRYPPGFLSLSASVACERFGFFLLASLLLLYLNERLGFTTAQATDVLGCFIAATYVSPLLAGAISDGRLASCELRLSGIWSRRWVMHSWPAESRPTLYAGLTLVALGAGAAKLAPQSLATRLFAAEPELRDRGLMLMYLLANVSALVSPVIGETARAWLGWPAAFALASLSLVAASLIIQTQSHVLRATERRTEVPAESGQTHDSGSLVMLFGLCALSVLFTIPQMQASSTLLLWTRDNTNRHLLGWELPVPYVASLHAGLVLAVSPLLARALLHVKTTPACQRLPPKSQSEWLQPALPTSRWSSPLCSGPAAPWWVWAGCSAAWRCCRWASCWSERSARRSCCDSLRLPVGVAGSGPGMAQRLSASGWLVGSAPVGSVCRTALFFTGMAVLALSGVALCLDMRARSSIKPKRA